VSRRRPRIGLLVDWLEDEYQNKVFAGVDAEAQANGVSLYCLTGGILRSPFRFGARRNFIYDLISPECVDALVIMSGTLGNYVGPSRLARYCERFRPLPMCSVGVALDGIPSVLVDNATGMRDAIGHLIEFHGYRKIAFIRGPGVNEEAEDRYRVYREVLADHGLPFNPELVTLGNFQASSGAESIRTMMDVRRVAFDAIVAANDFMALGALDALMARGVRIPQDVAIIGFDDIREGRFAPSPLTTVRQPLDRQGKLALELALAQLEGETITDHVILNTELVRRQSCGCSSYDAPERPAPEVKLEDATLLGTFQTYRADILAGVTQVIWASSPDIDVSSAVQIVDAFYNEIADKDVEEFLPTLDSAVHAAAETGGNVDAWQAIVTVLRQYALLAVDDEADKRAEVEEKLHEARAIIGGAAERAQARKRLQMEHWSRILRKSGEAHFTSLDVSAVMNTVQEQIIRLGIQSAYLAIFEDGQGTARLVLTYDTRSGEAESHRGEVYPAKLLVPPNTLGTDSRRTYVVEPLFFENEQLGFMLLELGPTEGVIYETLRDQIGSALKGALLVQQLVEETARREMAERDRLQKEMEIAERIQTSILPRNVEIPGMDAAAVMLPASEVGGDYYDILPYDGLCWFGIGDVAGHGLRTGLIMLMIESVVLALTANDPWVEPRNVLRIVNKVICTNVHDRLGQDEHATLTLLRIDREGRVTFSGAHEDILVFRSRTRRCETITTPGTWVGAVPDIEAGLIDSEQRLDPGDVLLLYTDGVTEAMDENQRQFGIERLRSEFESVAEQSVEAIRDHILSQVRSHTARQTDDVTVVVLRFRG